MERQLPRMNDIVERDGAYGVVIDRWPTFTQPKDGDMVGIIVQWEPLAEKRREQLEGEAAYVRVAQEAGS